MPEQNKINSIKERESELKRHSYGWVPDRPDHRDIMYSTAFKIPVNLPPKVDLRPMCSIVEDQEEFGNCTGNALVGALEFLEHTHAQR